MQPKAAPQDEEEEDDAATDCWQFKEFKRDAGAREPAGFCSNRLWNILERASGGGSDGGGVSASY